MHPFYCSIRHTILFSYLFLVIAFIIAFAAVSHVHSTRSENAAFKNHSLQMVKTFSQTASNTLLSDDRPAFIREADTWFKTTDILQIFAMDIAGTIWASTAKIPYKRKRIEPFHEEILKTAQAGLRTITYEGQSVLEVVVPVLKAEKIHYLVSAKIPLTSVQQQIARHTRSILSISFVMAIAGILFALFFSKRFSDPLLRLVQGTKEITKGNLSYRMPETFPYELAALGKSFNRLTHDLQQISETNNGHELRLKKIRDELEVKVEERTAELKRAAEDRILVEEKFRKVMEASPVPIAVFDMDGKPIYINPAFTQTFGWVLEEFQQEKTNYIPEEAQGLNTAIRRKIIKGESGHGIETRRLNKHGDLLDVSISFDVWRGKDNVPIGCVVILHDVTQSKQMEKQLFQAQKMEAMGTLAGGIAHDFNNILSGIFAFSQLAEKHAGDAEKTSGHIKQIVKGAQRAADLVRQILTFCRQTEYQKTSFHLEVVLKEALKLLHSTIPSNIEMSKTITPNVIVMADPTQIHQVIINLCTNACHAMNKNGGTLNIRLNKIRMTSLDTSPDFSINPGEYALLEIMDNGHGMGKDTLEKAFDPYFTTKKNGRGTGFGLAIVKAIVETHNGYIKVHSAPGKGANFHVYLPLSGDQIEAGNTFPKTLSIAGGTERIMVVDDEEAIRLAIKEFLEDYGYTVSTFENGKTAFEAFEKDPDFFDLILTDMTMPEMTGDDLAQKILSIRRDIPIILSTGYSEKISEAQALEAGVRFFIQKPVSNQELDTLIRKALDNDKSVTTISS